MDNETMWVCITGAARHDVTWDEIKQRRKAWKEQEKDALLMERCRSAQRYSVVGASPPRVFWLLETEDPEAVELIIEHFGDVWDLDSHLVIPQNVSQALHGESHTEEKR